MIGNKLYSLEGHIQMGNVLKDVRDLANMLACANRPSHRHHRLAKRLADVVSQLRSELDNEVCRLVPSCDDPRQIATKVYYGAPLVPNPRTNDAGDRFDGWAPQVEG